MYTILQANEDCEYLQDKLNAIHVWSQDWQLGISYKKCNLMYNGHTLYKPNLLLNDVSLAVVDEVRDLGVIIDSRLTFHTHIKQTVVHATVRANLIHNVLSHVMFLPSYVLLKFMLGLCLNTLRIRGFLTIS